MLQGMKNMLNKYSKLPYWIAAIEVGILSLGVGLISGWTSPYLAKLTKESIPFFVTKNESSWIVSLVSLGRILGAVVAAVTVAFYGSKKTAFLTGIPQLIGWLLLLTPNSVYWIYVSRFLSGICFGAFFVCFPLYIGEISNSKIRGALVSFIMICQPLGMLLGNILGAYLPMWQTSVISLIPCLLFLGTFLLLPESPHYLAKQKNYIEAEKAIQWYHRKLDSAQELSDIKEFVNADLKQTFANLLSEFNKPHNRKAMIISNVLFGLLQISGFYTISFYMEVILRSAEVDIIKPKMIVIFVNFIGIVAGWFGMYAIDRCGRRMLLTVSSAAYFIAMILLIIDFSLIHHGFDAKTIQWLAIVALIIYQIAICAGIMTVPCTILSETFAPSIKGYAASIVSITSGIFQFIATKTYQDFLNIMPAEYVYCIYACTMFIQLVYCFFIPETKGKTLQEIQLKLQRK